MQNKRKQFLDRLLKVADINEDLIDLGNPRPPPVIARRVKIFHMGQCQIDLPKTQELPLNKYATRVLTVSRKHKPSQVSPPVSTPQISLAPPSPTQFLSLIERKRSIVMTHLEQQKLRNTQIQFASQIRSQNRCNSAKQGGQGKKTRQAMFGSSQWGHKSQANQQNDLNTSIEQQIPFEQKSEENKRRFNQKQCTEPNIRPKTCRYRSQRLLSAGGKSTKSKLEEERQAKLSAMKQIHKNYARPFIPPPKITAKSYIVCEVAQESLKVCVCFNSKNSQEVASLTKIMTCTIVIEWSQRWQWDLDREEITIGRFEAHTPGTTASLRTGQVYTVKQLLYGLMLPSGNDASLALAVWCGRKHLELQQKGQISSLEGSSPKTRQSTSGLNESWPKSTCYQRFLDLMNIKAQQLKMTKTYYGNSHGLVNTRNKSTAYDVAVLSQYAISNSLFREIVSCPRFECTIRVQQKPREVTETDAQEEKVSNSIEKKQIESTCQFKAIKWENTHKLLHSRPQEYLGIKTGVTVNAGPCLCSLVGVNGREFLIVVLGCAKMGLRFKETEVLKKWLYRSQGIARRVKKATTLKLSVGNDDVSSSENESEEGTEC